MTFIYKTLQEITTSGGKLILELGQPDVAWTTYNQGAVDDLRIRYLGHGAEVLMQRLDDLIRQSSGLRLEIGKEIAKDPPAWARFISSLLRISPPITRELPAMKHYSSRPIDFEAMKPILQDGVLKWHGFKPPDPSGPASLFEVSCRVDTLATTVTKVPL